ncbi:MAG: hypothetical protein QOE58_1644, partial [Actinomycetota bacterium]|nr:hypothetical protein [Actinomycetota bacterium]
MNGNQVLRVVEAAETVRSWADSVSLTATAALVAEVEKDFADLGVKRTARIWTRFVRGCRSAVAKDIMVATGLPVYQCQRRVWLASCESERTGPVRELMRLGRLTFERAVALTEATADLDAFTAAAIATRVLRVPTGPDGVPLEGVAPLSQSTFRARLRAQLVLHHGPAKKAQRDHEAAVKARDLQTEAHRNGTGTLTLTGDGPRIAAAQGRVDRIARRLRKQGDPRTIAQLRADVATDLLLRGWVPGDPMFTQLGEPPAARVSVVVSLNTLLGLEQGIGQISGWGAIPAAQARKLALQAGSVWARIVTDPLTGRA